MSSKRIRSLKTMTAEPEFQRRSTRLLSRVSELDSRVTVFEPGNAFPFSPVSSAEEHQDAGEELEESPKRSRKRIKLESETDIADIEDGMYVPQRSPTRSRSQKVVKAKMKIKATPDEEDSPKPSASLKGKATTSPSKLKLIPQSLAVPHPAPPNWREVYDTIKSMRSQFIAPVDTMGCASAQTGETEPRVTCLSLPSSFFFLSVFLVLQNRRYASLVSLMLSSQTKDEVTYTAIANLRAAFGGSISLEAMIEADDEVIRAAISKVGFWKKKTGFVTSFP